MTTFRSFLVSLLVPPALVLSVVWAMLHPWFYTLEYHSPGFPPDPYGFTTEERMHWARYAVDYLRYDRDISYLADLRFPQGEQIPEPSCSFTDDCTRLYNPRELKHMVDVQRTVDGALSVWRFSLLGLLALGLWAWKGGWMEAFRRAAGRGGLWTAVFSGAILVFALVGFGVLFVAFHELFFESGTWTFYYSDTLIRLFPERFWRDAFLLVTGVPALAGLGIARFWGAG